MNYFKLLSFSFLVFLTHTQDSPLTTAIAFRLSYSSTITDLRNKVENFINEVRVNLMLDVQDLRVRGLGYRASGAEAANQALIYDIEARFDREFERISRFYIMEGTRMDELGIPVKEKERFILDLKAHAIDSINNVLNNYRSSLKLNS